MSKLKRLLYLVCSISLLAGCAADRINGSAKTIGTEVSKFQGELSSFQDGMKILQDDEQARIAGTNTRRDFAISSSRQLQVEWSITRAKSELEVFSALQSQGHDETARLTAPAVPASKSTPVTLPLGKLGAVAATMDGISKPPGTKADLEFLLNYAKDVNNQLKNVGDKASVAPQTSGPAASAKQ